MHLQKIDFYWVWLFVNYGNWWGGPKDLCLSLHNTFAESKERIPFFVKVKNVHFWEFQPVCGLFTCIMNWWGKFQLYGPSFSLLFASWVLLLYVCLALHFPKLKTVSLQSHILIFRNNISWLPGKQVFYDVICHFHLIFAFVKQKVTKTWRRNGFIQKMSSLDSPHSNTPIYTFFF